MAALPPDADAASLSSPADAAHMLERAASARRRSEDINVMALPKLVSKSVSFAQSPPPTPSVKTPAVKPPSLEFLRRRSSVCTSAEESAASDSETLLHNKSVKEAVERADLFWREATSGNRAYIRNHPFLNLFVYNETVIQGVFGRADTWFYLLFYVVVVCFRISHHSPDFTVRHSSDFSHASFVKAYDCMLMSPTYPTDDRCGTAATSRTRCSPPSPPA